MTLAEVIQKAFVSGEIEWYEMCALLDRCVPHPDSEWEGPLPTAQQLREWARPATG